MEVKQETGRGHGFLILAVLNISLYIEIERYLYSTNCCVELSVSRLSLWRSLSSVLYCSIWIEFRSGKVFKDPEIWFEKNCIFTCATCSQSGEAPNQSWKVPMNFLIVIPLPFSEGCSWTFCEVVSVRVRKYQSLFCFRFLLSFIYVLYVDACLAEERFLAIFPAWEVANTTDDLPATLGQNC